MLGLYLQLVSGLCAAGMGLAAKLAGGQGLPVMEIVLASSLCVGACPPRALRLPACGQPLRQLQAQAGAAMEGGYDSGSSSEGPALWVVRGVLGFVSVACIQEAVSLLAVSDAVALAMLSPLVVAAAGTLLLRERPPQMLLVALPMATSGALLLVRPAFFQTFMGDGAAHGADSGADGGTAGLAPAAAGVAFGLAHVLSSAGAKLSVRQLAAGSSSHQAASAIVLSAGLVSALGSAAACMLQQARLVWPQHAAGWALLAGMGAASFGHQAAMTAAMQRTPATRAAPLSYLSGVWSLAADFYLFGHTPRASSIVGGAAICLGGLLVTCERAQAAAGSSSASRAAGSPRAAAARQVPLLVDANTGGAVLLPLVKPAAERQRSGPIPPGLLRDAIANAWQQSRAGQQLGAGPLLPVVKPAPLATMHIKDENLIAARGTAVRMA
ncbi:hypothetical protein CHLNCDRAFT_145531 [Chlorella variabilis]|uniref:EamA domain-containing protein n=1 Tax=Chlorella variabilis TaxID=554065 RepID=E1ZDP9_CHLVA|nr:hypothetical protein CHLNCDRAFT_145531 [Chlorella variabilis]EFN56060.1 hypothetical protein CHLNCDRAFT_145531 [Chlorella variabilis]|eukprot:XP_005848162.1 hypothetical protein CHLNCDRAFT_145531 [Chlorella variabilis]